MAQSLQDRYAPQTSCFGCGPANPQGLQIKSFPDEEGLVCRFTPQSHHQGFPGFVNGGIIGTLFDCHMNWTAAYFLMQRDASPGPPPTVTAEFSVFLEKPTPLSAQLTLRARVVDAGRRRVTVEGELWAEGQRTARARGVFVAVQEGHPAWGRW
ncbi:MAG: PaaI family thioesterase [Thermoanaerobaculum sp.]|nr:PaaI family thioesterase [Thermoanaerobaculum sp.]